MGTQLIGQRLTQLRNELAKPGEKPWSQTRVAEATGLPRNTLLRLEHAGAGTIEALTTLLTFYHRCGFNPSWVLLADNSAVPKKNRPDVAQVVATAVVVKKVRELKANLLNQVDAVMNSLTE